jgi:hypothetical protein
MMKLLRRLSRSQLLSMCFQHGIVNNTTTATWAKVFVIGKSEFESLRGIVRLSEVM